MKNGWDNKPDYENNEILECEEDGFQNILTLTKQEASDKNEENQDGGSLSPLGSKIPRNNAFQDDMFKEIEADQDLKQNKKTSDYLFNHDL
jgi:hypothetical protein